MLHYQSQTPLKLRMKMSMHVFLRIVMVDTTINTTIIKSSKIGRKSNSNSKLTTGKIYIVATGIYARSK
jgi:hypothetical protein